MASSSVFLHHMRVASLLRLLNLPFLVCECSCHVGDGRWNKDNAVVEFILEGVNYWFLLSLRSFNMAAGGNPHCTGSAFYRFRQSALCRSALYRFRNLQIPFHSAIYRFRSAKYRHPKQGKEL